VHHVGVPAPNRMNATVQQPPWIGANDACAFKGGTMLQQRHPSVVRMRCLVAYCVFTAFTFGCTTQTRMEQQSLTRPSPEPRRINGSHPIAFHREGRVSQRDTRSRGSWTEWEGGTWRGFHWCLAGRSEVPSGGW
jgi:hypothetical protein